MSHFTGEKVEVQDRGDLRDAALSCDRGEKSDWERVKASPQEGQPLAEGRWNWGSKECEGEVVEANFGARLGGV